MDNPSTYYAYASSPLGLLHISASDTHITRVHFLTEAETASTDTTLESPNAITDACVNELEQYFTGQLKTFTVPVAQPGTEFQQRVWAELLNIHYGKTISYLTLSKRLGDPKAIRAAAATNGKNNIAVIVPCHRVIGSNQDLVGYAGGLWRKKWLLDHEAKLVFGIQTLF